MDRSTQESLPRCKEGRRRTAAVKEHESERGYQPGISSYLPKPLPHKSAEMKGWRACKLLLSRRSFVRCAIVRVNLVVIPLGWNLPRVNELVISHTFVEITAEMMFIDPRIHEANEEL